MWVSKEFDETADYCIIDDVSFGHMNPATRHGIWGAQERFSHRDLYTKGSFRWGKPCIWICNEEKDPFTQMVDGKYAMAANERDWYTANCVVYTVTAPLFRTVIEEPVIKDEVILVESEGELSDHSIVRRREKRAGKRTTIIIDSDSE